MDYVDWDMENGGRCREWTCCGLIWQMIVSPAWEGTNANFRCPKCGDIQPWVMPELGRDFCW